MMNFRIADTFTDSLRRLTDDEQKAVKNTAFDLQLNPANPGMSFHKLENIKDKAFWSVRVNADIRLIVHRTDNSLMLCYVDHHDKAYAWAQRRKLETHPATGAAQLVEIRETVREIVVPKYVDAVVQTSAKTEAKKKKVVRRPFEGCTDEQLLSYGVPTEWMVDVKGATDDSFGVLIDHLPAEASEALMNLAATGVARPTLQVTAVHADPFAHPDAQRRFRVMNNVDELRQAMDYPWEKWTVFLHPDQRQWVERQYNGPARVSGSAGTGKTIVAIHRAAFLARSEPDARVLLTTYSDVLANALQTKLNRLLGSEPKLAERIDVASLNTVGLRLYKAQGGKESIVTQEVLRAMIRQASEQVEGHPFGQHFLSAEWEQVVDAWQLTNWEAYRDVARLGRRTRLPAQKREVLWAIFEKVIAGLKQRQAMTWAQMFDSLAVNIRKQARPIYDFAVVDESQDISQAHLRFLAALGGDRAYALFFAGDLGQRIFQQPFSWKTMGVDIRGRSRTLRVNYRTSHQIRSQADRLLDPTVMDVDENTEDRRDTVSVFNGPEPTIDLFDSEADEIKAVGLWIKTQVSDGVLPHEFGLFVRSDAQLDRAKAAAKESGLPWKILDERVDTTSGQLSISTMHLAKGLEFRAVAVMACDEEVIPLQERIETVGDDADLREVYDTERHLLYVACTRSRDHLLVTALNPGTEFLDDLTPSHHVNDSQS